MLFRSDTLAVALTLALMDGETLPVAECVADGERADESVADVDGLAEKDEAGDSEALELCEERGLGEPDAEEESDGDADAENEPEPLLETEELG